jgi:hypothetical protein
MSARTEYPICMVLTCGCTGDEPITKGSQTRDHRILNEHGMAYCQCHTSHLADQAGIEQFQCEKTLDKLHAAAHAPFGCPYLDPDRGKCGLFKKITEGATS